MIAWNRHSTLLLAFLLTSVMCHALDTVAPGRLMVDPPTLENLGFRWYIEGDDNRNATVAVSYRRKGDRAWKTGLPLLRVHREVVNRAFAEYRTGNLFAGSVLFLRPDTEYDVRLVMQDPDGGSSTKTLTVATRAEPVAFREGRRLNVYPSGYGGKRPAGSYEGLMAAYNTAQPGDILLVHKGVYRGSYTLTRSGAPGKPIVLRGAGDGEVVFHGDGHQADLFNVDTAGHLMFEDLTLRHAKHAILGGAKGSPGAPGLTVRRCRISDVIFGVTTASENSRDWYIADNVLIGTNTAWYPRPRDYMSPSHTGVNAYGRGNVVCRNSITRFSDGIAPANYGPPPDDLEKHPVALDIYDNDISWAQDDCIETDYGAHNFRVYRNRCYNAHTGISAQPFYGGPVYLVRNEIYGVTALTFKLHNYCTGILAYHNTVCSAGSGFQSFDRWQNGHFRNNLFLGGETVTRTDGSNRIAYAMATGTITPYSTLDYDGFRRNMPGDLIRWFDGNKIALYPSLAAFAEATGHERHGVMVDYDVFLRAVPPRAGVTSEPTHCDLRLRAGASPVDAGIALPNINEAYTGRAPDMGCHEIGSPAARYGPR
ncbi:MAG TPA: hypothetical protein VFB63_08360 [Bryobacteraceae bacterium]|nr:hypothetical protein [Bryobacteraceae bacterium]